MGSDGDSERLLVSYLTLRKAIGYLGIGLPVVLIVGDLLLSENPGLQPTISDYYRTVMSGVLVGILFGVGVFLFSYDGYEKADRIAGWAACAFAVAVALFPVSSESDFVRNVHVVSAIAMFLVLAYFSLFLFTKSKESSSPTPRKLVRNRVYVTCGVVIVGCLGLIGIYYWLLDETAIQDLNPVLWLESVALWAFGISWFIKGEALLGDKSKSTTE
jgi:hypothetical protein